MPFIYSWLANGARGWFPARWNELLLIRTLALAHQRRRYGEWPLYGVGLDEAYGLQVVACGRN